MSKMRWGKPRKINPDGKPVRIHAVITQEQFELLRAYGDGHSMLELSGANLCNRSTISRELQTIARKLTAGRKPTAPH